MLLPHKPRVLLVVPAYNEREMIRSTLEAIDAARRSWEDLFDITIMGVDNNSTDSTAAAIQSLPFVRFRREPLQGKGHAVLGAWEAHAGEYEIYAFTDADLATDPATLPKLFSAIAAGADLAVCTRRTPEARVSRPWGRRFVSRVAAAANRIIAGASASDLSCGCKAISGALVPSLTHRVRERKWFFDAELIVRAEWEGKKIVEIPAVWAERRSGNDKSKIRVMRASLRHLYHLWLLRKR